MTDRIHLLVCHNCEREVRAILAVGDGSFEGVTASSFPSHCGCPPLSEEEARRSIPDGAIHVEVIGGACLNALSAPESLPRGWRIHTVTPCFRMFADPQLIDRILGEGAYLMTSGGLSRWREQIDVWGFNQEDLHTFMCETTKRLHLLDTGIDPDSPAHLEEMAEYVQLPHETTWGGLEFFRLFLKDILWNCRLELQKAHADEADMHFRRIFSDYAMVMDIFGKFTRVQTEEEIIHQILELFTMLFDPSALDYVAFVDGHPEIKHTLRSGKHPLDGSTLQRIAEFHGDAAHNETESGFILRVSFNDETLGLVIVDNISFPQYGLRYRNLSHTILPICGLSIRNARIYQEVVQKGEALRRANQKLDQLTIIDGLTQIANRRRFDEVLSMELRRAIRGKSPLSLIMVDIDFFKSLNDSRGHLAGDECLKAVARIIAGCVVRAGDLVARYGGDEFAVILTFNSSQGAYTMAEEIRMAVLDAKIEHGNSAVGPYVTLTLGVYTVIPDMGTQPGDIIALADEALYKAKTSGRNQIWMDPESDQIRS